MPTSDFYTYQRDVRTPAGGSVVAYAATSGLQLHQGEMVAYSSNIRQVVRFVRDGTQGKFAGGARDSQASMRKRGKRTVPAVRCTWTPPPPTSSPRPQAAACKLEWRGPRGVARRLAPCACPV